MQLCVEHTTIVSKGFLVNSHISLNLTLVFFFSKHRVSHAVAIGHVSILFSFIYAHACMAEPLLICITSNLLVKFCDNSYIVKSRLGQEW